MIPERSLRSTNTIPPLLRAFCTHPINVILLPVISFVTSAQRQVLCSPFILSAIACVSFFVIYLLYSVAEKFYKFRIAFRGHLFFLEFLILLHNGKVHLYAAASLLFSLFQDREKFVRRHVFLYEEGFLLCCSRNLVSSFQKKHDDSFKTNGKTAGRGVLAGKFADHLVVPSAASHRTAELVHRDLKNRSCVIGHSAHKSGIKGDPEISRLHSVNRSDDGFQVLRHLRSKNVLQFIFQIAYALDVTGNFAEKSEIGVDAFL